MVNRTISAQVPGNFHVSTHSATAQPQNPDMTHSIHKLAFGDKLQVRPQNKWEAEKLEALKSEDLFLPFCVMQVHNVKGAFNALGGADKLSSNRTYPPLTCSLKALCGRRKPS